MSKFITNPANENEILSIEGCRDEIDRLNQELQKKQKIISKAIKFLENEYNSYPSAEEWRNALKDILSEK